MGAAKNQFNAIVENHNKLAETLTAQAKEAMQPFVIDEASVKEGKTLFDAYVAKNRELAEAMMTPNAWEKMPENYAKAIALQTEYFNKTMAYYKNLAGKYSLKNAQENAKKMSELYKTSLESIVKTGEANAQILRDYWKA